MVNLQGNWNYPNQIVAGAGRLQELSTECLSRGFVKPLLVTDTGISSLPMFQQLADDLAKAEINVKVFDTVKPNPDESSVSDGVAIFNKEECDSVIAFGGGSVLDAAKAIALMVGQERPIWDFEDVGSNWERVKVGGMASVIAIPTTAGTGSEVGRASVITDSEAHVKKIIFHPNMLPELVILDPLITKELPPHITAATGLDALSHCLEALCAPTYHPMADGIAIEGVRLVKEFLPRAYKDGGDLEARMQMLVASSMGATAFQKGLGAMHAISHSVGAVYGAHHGLLNAILMPYILLENLKLIEEKLARTASYIGLQGSDGLAFVSWVNQLRDELGIPKNLASIGVKEADVSLLAAMSVKDPSAAGNPVQLTEEDYSRLILNAIRGLEGDVESGDFAM